MLRHLFTEVRLGEHKFCEARLITGDGRNAAEILFGVIAPPNPICCAFKSSHASCSSRRHRRALAARFTREARRRGPNRASAPSRWVEGGSLALVLPVPATGSGRAGASRSPCCASHHLLTSCARFVSFELVHLTRPSIARTSFLPIDTFAFFHCLYIFLSPCTFPPPTRGASPGHGR